jgi:hypothetical protein
VNFDLVDRYKWRLVVYSWLTCAFGHVPSSLASWLSHGRQAGFHSDRCSVLAQLMFGYRARRSSPPCGWAPFLLLGRWNGLLHFPPILVVPGERSRPNILEWSTISTLWVVNCNHLRIYCTIKLVIDNNKLEVSWKGAVMCNWSYYSGIHMEGQRRVMKQPGQSVFGPSVRPGAFLLFSFRGHCASQYFIPFLGGPTKT